MVFSANMKYLKFVNPDQLYLFRLWSAFGELANTYYRDEGRRIRARLEKKNYTSVELNVRYCFKVWSFWHCGALLNLCQELYRLPFHTAVNVKIFSKCNHIF